MSQPMNQVTNTASTAEAPIKRKRGRPRKDEGQSSPRAPVSSLQRQRSGSSKLTTNLQSKAKDIAEDAHGYDDVYDDVYDDDNNDDYIKDEMVGKAVTGVLECAFEAGYFLTVKVEGDTNVSLKGIVFKEGCVVPVTPENDLVPHLKMCKRGDFPIPAMKVSPKAPPVQNIENQNQQQQQQQQQNLASENITQKQDHSVLQELQSDDKEQHEKLSDDKEQHEKLSDDKVLQDKLSDDKVLQDKLSDDKVLQDNLSDDKVLQDNLSDDKVLQDKLSDDEVMQDKLSDDKVLQDKLSDDEVLQDKLSDDKVLQDKLSDDKVLQDKLSDDKVLQDKLSDDEVLQDKLSDDEVLQDKLSDDEVLQDKLSDDEVLQDKLSDDEVLQDKLSVDKEQQQESEKLSTEKEGLKELAEKKTDQMTEDLSDNEQTIQGNNNNAVSNENSVDVKTEEAANDTVTLKESDIVPPENVCSVKDSSDVIPAVIEENDDESCEPPGELASAMETD